MTQDLSNTENKNVGQFGSPHLGRGHEEPSDQEDLEIPRAKLIQPTSEEATTENKEDRIELGLIVNSLTKEHLPEVFVPIFKFTNFLCWNPRKKEDPNFDPAYDPGALIFSTDNPNDPRVIEGKEFGPNGEAPKVTKYLNFFSYFPGNDMPIIVSFAKTSRNAGKRLNTLSQFKAGDMFAYQYKLISKQADRDGTKYYVLEVSAAGKTPEEHFKVAEGYYESFRGRQIKVHQEDDSAPKKESQPVEFEE